MNIEIFHSACPHDCPSTCALEVERLGTSEIGRIRGAKANTYTDGVICAKVARYSERVHHPERLTSPLQRVGEKGGGQFRAISWDAALDEVANAFERVAQLYGSEAVWPYYYAGTMGLVQRDGINRLRHVMRYSGQDTTICTTLADAGWAAGAGAFLGTDPREMSESDLIVMWGGNPASTQVNVMNHISKARKDHGAKFIVIDPYKTRTAQVADTHLALKPGTDGALACSIMHILFRDGYADESYLKKYTDYPKELEDHLRARDPEWGAQITGLNVEEIESIGKLYGKTKRSFLRLGYGFTRSRNGASNMHAVSCLPAVTGAWKYRGGGALYSNKSIYGWDKTIIEGLDCCDPNIRKLDMSRIGEVLTGNAADLEGGPPVQAMIIQSTNPAVVAPDSTKVNSGLQRDDLFLCVHEQFLTDTAKLADIVLPATTFLEHYDLYQGGGHSHAMIGPKIIEPYEDSRENHEVICGLAKRLGAQHTGFDMSAMEIVDHVLSEAKYPSADKIIKEGWYDCMPDFETAHHLNGWPTPSKRFRFRGEWKNKTKNKYQEKLQQIPELPDHFESIDSTDSIHPFRLITSPAHNFLNTSFTETTTSKIKEGRPEILLTSMDAAALKLREGEIVKVGNQQGHIVIHVAITKSNQQCGVVVIESIWPNNAFKTGLGVNVLTSAERGMPEGGAVFHDTKVWIEKYPS
jgi:anaerobic selenocysteine-containing dehydrogenase